MGKPDKLDLVFVDLETAPMLSMMWSPKQRYVPMEMKQSDYFVLTYAARRRGQKRIRSGMVTGKEAVAQDDERILVEIADIIRGADYMVAHNADGFDLGRLNNRLMLLELEPLGPVKTIDTLKLSKRSFNRAYHKLDDLAQEMGIGEKHDTDFSLWEKAFYGDEKALRYMRKYNKHDVEILEPVFNRMVPYVKGLPRMVDGNWSGFVCPSCGSENVIKRGFYRTKGSTFQRWQCKETTCQRYSRERVSDKRKKLNLFPL